MIKWWKKLFLHLYDLAVVSVHILHTKTYKKSFHWKFSTKKVAKGLLTGASAEMQVQVQTRIRAGRLVWRYLFIYYIYSVPGGKVNILGGHSIGHSKQNTLYEHVSYSERFPR